MTCNHCQCFDKSLCRLENRRHLKREPHLAFLQKMCGIRHSEAASRQAANHSCSVHAGLDRASSDTFPMQCLSVICRRFKVNQSESSDEKVIPALRWHSPALYVPEPAFGEHLLALTWQMRKYLQSPLKLVICTFHKWVNERWLMGKFSPSRIM